MNRVSRGAVFWGAAFITGGLVVLGIQQGLVSEQVVSEAARWWPLFLIGAGVAIIFAGVLGVIATAVAGILLGVLVGGLIAGAGTITVGCGGGDPLPLAALEDGSFSGHGAEVQLEVDCTKLEVTGSGTDGNWAVQADVESAPDVVVESGSDNLDVRTESQVTVVPERPRHVGVTLAGDAEVGLELRINAGEASVDLSEGHWGSLDLQGNAMSMFVDLSDAASDSVDLQVNAGSAEVQLSDGSHLGSMVLGVNAGSIDVCAPDGLGLQFTVGNNVASSHNLDEAALSKSGNVWRTANYDSADEQVDITFNGNAASLTLNPEGGCS